MAKNKNDKIIDGLIADIVDDDVEIVEKYGKEWGIRPISSKEYLSVLNKSKQYREDGATRFYGMQIEVLRYALVSLNGIELTLEQKNKLLESVSQLLLVFYIMNLNGFVISVMINSKKKMNQKKKIQKMNQWKNQIMM